MPWRPEPDPTCPDTGYGAGFAWRASNGTCYNGYAFPIVVSSRRDHASQHVHLRDRLQHANVGLHAARNVGGPYTSLNVGLNVLSAPTVGTDNDPDAVYWNTKTAAWYSDGGAAGVGIFRPDTGWALHIPAIRFSTVN